MLRASCRIVEFLVTRKNSKALKEAKSDFFLPPSFSFLLFLIPCPWYVTSGRRHTVFKLPLPAQSLVHGVNVQLMVLQPL